VTCHLRGSRPPREKIMSITANIYARTKDNSNKIQKQECFCVGFKIPEQVNLAKGKNHILPCLPLQSVKKAKRKKKENNKRQKKTQKYVGHYPLFISKKKKRRREHENQVLIQLSSAPNRKTNITTTLSQTHLWPSSNGHWFLLAPRPQPCLGSAGLL
jgi:hypothetical protein